MKNTLRSIILAGSVVASTILGGCGKTEYTKESFSRADTGANISPVGEVILQDVDGDGLVDGINESASGSSQNLLFVFPGYEGKVIGGRGYEKPMSKELRQSASQARKVIQDFGYQIAKDRGQIQNK